MSPIALGLRGLGVGSPDKAYRFLPGGVAFTPSMAKRTGAVFAAAPIVQGHRDVTKSDIVIAARGVQFGNPVQITYANFDPYQGTISLWITPEWDGNDGLNHFLCASEGGTFSLRKSDGGYLRLNFFTWLDTGNFVDVSGWVAGTRYHVVARWDFKNTLDGTNHAAISVNDVHTYGETSVTLPGSFNNICIGAYPDGAASPANAIIEGLTIYRRVLYDGTYGVPATFDASGPVDEIAAIYAAGAGADPCLVTGSWDVCFCLPTNASEGALVTGTGEAWSHPHTSDVLNHWTLEDAFYGGGQWAVGFNGTSSYINCGSAAALDDLPNGATLTVDGWVRSDDASNTGMIAAKGQLGANGWHLWVQSDGQVIWRVYLATTSVSIGSGASSTINDGKWHHVAAYYDDATKTGRLAIDGVWGAADVGAGAYQADAAWNLCVGRRSDTGAYYWDGAIGWVRLSNNDRFTAGTDFIPPREFPAADGNTIEAWSLNDGTGATAAAQVTTPGNDGTITAGTWEQQWDDVLTPVLPTSLEFDGAATSINCGSAAALDDLPNGAILTVDGWFRCEDTGEAVIVSKLTWISAGWMIYLNSSGNVVFNVQLATSDVNAEQASADYRDGKWHHFAAHYDDATKTGRVAVDGQWGNSNTGAGAYQLDAAADFYFGQGGSAGNWRFLGAIAWLRLSDNDRHTAGSTFVPPDRVNPPAPDGNTVEQWNLDEGAGTTAAAQVTTPGNDGTITMGSGRWWNSPDMVSDSPGARVLPWGYAIGSDGAGDGIHQHQAGLSAGQNYVARCLLRYEADKRARPQIVAYDETNGAAISTFRAPFLTGTHDGGNNLATLSDSTAPYWPYSLVGGTVYNITDGSSATITACGTSITAVLAGGTDNDWDNGDVYYIVPPARWVFAEPFCFELPTIARNGAAADCTAISFRLLNQAGEGVIYWLQAELLKNGLDNPSMETGAGVAPNPWIPDGWTNAGLDPGVPPDSEQELTIVHSGASGVKFNTTAIWEGLVGSAGFALLGQYVSVGLWSRCDGSASVCIDTASTANAYFQYDPGEMYAISAVDGAWTLTSGVIKIISQAVYRTRGLVGPTGPRYVDDAYTVALNDVSLTVTPASKANSQEASGLRVDGRDGCTDAITGWSPVSGAAVWSWTPRHDAADLVKFDEAGDEAYLLEAEFDANNRIGVYASAANTITLEVVVGGVPTTNTWNCAGALVAGTSYPMRLEYNHLSAKLYVGGVLRVTVTPGAGINFGASTPNLMNWGSNYLGAKQGDATFAP